MDNFLAYPLEPRGDSPDTDIEEALRSLMRFRSALRKEDQDVVDSLLVSIKEHWPLHTIADYLASFEFLLLSMLIEQQKAVNRLSSEVEALTSQLKSDR